MAQEKRDILIMRIMLPDGNVRWTKELDGLDNFSLSETNQLLILDNQGMIIGAYNPLGWVSFSVEYAE